MRNETLNMKSILQHKLIMLFVLLFNSSYSQETNRFIFTDIHYPIPVGENGLNNFTGILALGIEYNLTNNNRFNLGLDFQSSIFLNNNLSNLNPTSLLITPKLKLDYSIFTYKLTIIPQFSLGYSMFWFHTPEFDMQIGDSTIHIQAANEFRNGLSARVGSKFVLKSNRQIAYYIEFSYEYTRLERPKIGLDVSYNRDYHVLNPGIGLIWKLKLKRSKYA